MPLFRVSKQNYLSFTRSAQADTQIHTGSMVPLADKANLVGWFVAATAWMLIDYYYSTLSREDNLEQSIHKMFIKSKKKKTCKNNYLTRNLNPATFESSHLSPLKAGNFTAPLLLMLSLDWGDGGGQLAVNEFGVGETSQGKTPVSFAL